VTIPQLLVDLLTLLFNLAVPAAMCTLVLAGVALRHEGGVNFEMGGRFHRWMLWSAILLTLPQFLSWFAARGISMPPQASGFASSWLTSLQRTFSSFVSDIVVGRLIPVLAAFLVLKAVLDGAEGKNPLGSVIAAMFLLSVSGTLRMMHNDCSDAKVTTVVKQKPGASPSLFGEFLMNLCAFVFLEDIAGKLPPYEEKLVSVPMDPEMQEAYSDLEQDIKSCLMENRRNRSVISKMLNTLLLYPDHPFGLGTIYGKRRDQDRHWETFVIATPRDLPDDRLYSKERRLIEIVKAELAQGRLCHVFAVYTKTHDVTARISEVLSRAGIGTAVLKASVPTTQREAWYARKVAEGVQVVISHPKLVETGLDLLDFPTLIFYETGYSLHTLRQASRRSWRIGQDRPVRVSFLCQEGTMQTKCLRLMGKKLLVALTIEGKFAAEGLHDIEDDDDMLSAMARELVEKDGIGETADHVWSQLKEVYDQLPSASYQVPAADQDDNVFEDAEFEDGAGDAMIDELPLTEISQPDLVAPGTPAVAAPTLFGQPLPSARRNRRRIREADPLQRSLFSWN
jgi:hypothetical protein